MANLPHEYTESWLWGYSVSGLQGLRLGIGRVAIDGRGKAQEFFFETDPTPTCYTGQAKAGSDIKAGEKNFPIQKFGTAIAKA